MKKSFVKKAVIVLSSVIGGLVLIGLILFSVGLFLYRTADFMPPEIVPDLAGYVLETDEDSLKVCGDNSLVQNEYGVWEAHLSGEAADRGTAYGVMSKDLLRYQEDAFVDQIFRMIPSESWVRFLHKLIIIFNRNIAGYIPQEYRDEIFGLSLSGTDDYDVYGSSYIRQLNYHAAHDIGHAMQQYMLVGCSSFAVWDEAAATGDLLIGRNFDFYVGDRFADNKVILFMAPSEGYKFASVTWPGMMGVLSGMNEAGLTVTINAAKGAVPTSSATPISLLTREILQYAGTIEEADSIARSHKTFVSESILVGSAKDGIAAIIEKTPEKTAMYKTEGSYLVCTNHYQSEAFADDEYNVANIAGSDSKYRYDRIDGLIGERLPVDEKDAADILRDRFGAGGRDIGLTNEKSVNQFIAHHSVIFSPSDLKMWVSTHPWQLGAYLCYDLNEAFSEENAGKSCAEPTLHIAADSLSLIRDYGRVVEYREKAVTIIDATDKKTMLPDGYIDRFVAGNPELYRAYDIAGDYMLMTGNRNAAVGYWETALTKETARTDERTAIEKKIKKYGQKN